MLFLYYILVHNIDNNSTTTFYVTLWQLVFLASTESGYYTLKFILLLGIINRSVCLFTAVDFPSSHLPLPCGEQFHCYIPA